LQRYGAEIELMKAGEQAEEANKLAKQAGLHGATTEIPGRLKCLKEEETDPNVYWLRQFSNPSNLEGQAVIGKEILEQTQGKVDVFIASVGTGGTFLGVSQVLKAALPNVRCIAIQPLGWKGGMDPLAADAKYVPGITGGLLKEIRDSGIADQVITLPSDEAVDMAFRLSREEGLNCGMSTGANVLIALREASKPGMRGKNVVTIMVDGGYRYISLEKYVT
jgi:cysteine synthase A